MKLSVCMTTYNGAKYIREQLESILNQTRQPDEVILCDDCSADETVKIISDFIAEHHLEQRHWRLIQNETNKGYPFNFYYAMDECKGDAVFLADQDDLWHTQKLEIMGKVLEEDDRYCLVACKYSIVDSQGRLVHTVMNPTQHQIHNQNREITVSDVLYRYEWPGMVLAYKREWFEHLISDAEIDENYKAIPHDMLLCLLGAESKRFIQLEQVLSSHRRHENNAAKEEHRIRVLLNKERKIGEIENYLSMLENIVSANVLKQQETYEILRAKQEAMQARYLALKTGKLEVLRTAWKYRRMTRIFTWMCDFLIA